MANRERLSPIPILSTVDAGEGVAWLDKAWDRPETFLLVRELPGAQQLWLQNYLEQVPEDLRMGHFILLTSGSTGLPKLVIGSRVRAEQMARAIHAAQSASSISEAIVVLPLHYCYAFVNQWLWARIHQRTLICTAGFADPAAVERAIRGTKESMLCLVASHIQLFKDHFAGKRFPEVTLINFAGGQFPQARIPELLEIFPNANVFNNYGCAEALPRLTVRRLSDSSDGSNVGWPLPGIELRSNDRGELQFRSQYQCIAMLDQDGFHRIADIDWTRTGDVAEQQIDGSFRIVGRANDVFKRYGEKVSVTQLSLTIHSVWSGHAEFYRDVDKAGEPAAVLVLSPKPSEADLRDILRSLRQGYPRPHWPIRIEVIENIPLLANGKVDRLRLKAASNKQVIWSQVV